MNDAWHVEEAPPVASAATARRVPTLLEQATAHGGERVEWGDPVSEERLSAAERLRVAEASVLIDMMLNDEEVEPSSEGNSAEETPKLPDTPPQLPDTPHTPPQSQGDGPKPHEKEEKSGSVGDVAEWSDSDSDETWNLSNAEIRDMRSAQRKSKHNPAGGAPKKRKGKDGWVRAAPKKQHKGKDAPGVKATWCDDDDDDVNDYTQHPVNNG